VLEVTLRLRIIGVIRQCIVDLVGVMSSNRS
jgi:hypothetical protein